MLYEKGVIRGGSRAAATSKMERFVIIVHAWKSLTITTKRSILNVVAALDPPLVIESFVSSQEDTFAGASKHSF